MLKFCFKDVLIAKSKLKLYFITFMSEVCVMEEQTELTLEAIGGQN